MSLPLNRSTTAPARRFAIICFGYDHERMRRQPWHVARGIAMGMAGLGHHATILTDAVDPPPAEGYALCRVDSLIERGELSGELREQLVACEPERVFIITGARELARLGSLALPAPTSLVMASPRLTLAEFLRLGPGALWRERGLLALPLANALLPGLVLRRGFVRSRAEEIIYLSRAARQRYMAAGLPAGRFLPPQVDPGLCAGLPAPAGRTVVTYLGPALAARGADLALAAFEEAVARGLDAELDLLLRPDGPASASDPGIERLLARVAASPVAGRIRTETTKLDPAQLRERLVRAHAFLLPFVTPISEVPLVVIEAGLSGRPVVALEAPGVSEVVRALHGEVATSAAELPTAILRACAQGRATPALPQSWTSWDQAVRPLAGRRPRQPGDFRLIAICGVDGAGKTTVLRALQARLESEGILTRHVWSRFRNYASKPLLALARLTGHNRKEQHPGFRIGYHRFQATAYARPFLALQAFDAALDAGLRYRGPGLILADRCLLDTLVDLAVDTGLDELIMDRLAPRLKCFLPRPALAIVMTRSPGRIATARPDAIADRHFARRRALYGRLARQLGLPVIANDGSVDDAVDAILAVIAGDARPLLP